MVKKISATSRSQSWRGPLVMIFFLYVILAGSLVFGLKVLPDPVASHFDGRGVPDGWTSRGTYHLAMLGTAIFLPGIVVGSCFAFRFLPESMINLPNSDYWLSSERRAQTERYVFRQSLWFASMAIFFVTCAHLSVVEANSKVPPRLSLLLLGISAGGFLVGTVAWSTRLLWPFLKKTPRQEGTRESVR